MHRIEQTMLLVGAWSLVAVSFAAAGTRVNTGPVERGDDLFRQGRFAEAREAYEAALAGDATNGQATLRLGEIALLGNRFDQAERHLKRAIELGADDDRAKSLLAEAYYRQDDFQRAAALYRDVGRDGFADQLESFKGATPYKLVAKSDTTRVKFVRTDPLPIVSARVNGGDEIHLLIDTGGPEWMLDPKFADSIGLVRFGSTTGTFAGGKQAAVHHARIDSIRLGEFDIQNVPVNLLPSRHLPFGVGGKPIDGVIGTVFLYHFVSTLDYPRGELVLRRRTDQALAELDKQAESQPTHVLPFWMAGDHYMVAWGQLNRTERCLMFVDTGMAGGGFTCTESAAKAANIDLSGPSFEGIGGGGPVTVTPFVASQLALGDARQSNLQGLFGALPPSGVCYS